MFGGLNIEDVIIPDEILEYLHHEKDGVFISSKVVIDTKQNTIKIIEGEKQ